MSKQRLTLEALATYRSFPIALGQEIAQTRVTDHARMAILTRNYMSLLPADRLRCINELELCKLAKRGGVEAMVA